MPLISKPTKSTITLDYGKNIGRYSTSAVHPEASAVNVKEMADAIAKLQGDKQHTTFWSIRTDLINED